MRCAGNVSCVWYDEDEDEDCNNTELKEYDEPQIRNESSNNDALILDNFLRSRNYCYSDQ